MRENIKRLIAKTPLGECFKLLNRQDQKYLLIIVGTQMVVGILDIMGIALMGIVGALSVSGIQSKEPSVQVQELIAIVNLSEISFQKQVVALAVLAAFLLCIKSIFSLIFTRRVIFYLTRRGANVSSDLLRKVASLPLSDIRRHSEQSLIYAVSSGVNVVMIGVIASFCNLIADSALLIMLAAALFFINPIIAALSVLLFGLTSYLLYLSTRKRALKFGKLNTEMNVASNSGIQNLFALYRELTVRNRKAEYVEKIADKRRQLGVSIAEINFLPNLSKYVMEISLVFGGFVIVGTELLLHDAMTATSALAVFLTAATRITPAILRVQQNATGIKNSLGMAEPTLSVIKEFLSESQPVDANATELVTSFIDNVGDSGKIVFNNVSYKYQGANRYSIYEVSLDVTPNEMIALVGPSGAGKSTLVDLLLGVIRPSSGFVRIYGKSPRQSLIDSRLSVGYVPQKVAIIEDSLRENLLFGYSREEISEESLWRALELAELKSEIIDSGLTLDSRMGPGGLSLSGGQRQRLGIARALLREPRILVMDEATNALDSETEAKLNATIQKMKGRTTLIIIAHRLSSVVSADKVAYLNNGRLLAYGAFSEVREKVPDFDQQAKLLGL